MTQINVTLSPSADARLRALAAAGHVSLKRVIEDGIAVLHWHAALDRSEPFSAIDLLVDRYAPSSAADSHPAQAGQGESS